MRIWMRELGRLTFILGAAGMTFGAPSTARAVDLSGSNFTFTIGALPPIVIAQSPDPLPISIGAGNSFQQPVVFAETVVLAPALFTGVSLISSLNLTLSAPPTTLLGTFAPAGGQAGGFGGSSPLVGQSVVGVLGGVVNLVVPLGVVGVGGTTKVAAFSLNVTVTGAEWTTGVVKVTGITTTITKPGGTISTLNTAITTGSDNRTLAGAGTVVLVSPARVLTNAAGNLPSFAVQQLTFAPEPTRALLWAAAAAGLWAVGRLRNRR